MTYEDIIKAAIPHADEVMIDFILYSRTPFPCSRVSAKELYKASRTYHRALRNKVQLCDLCDNMLQLDDRFACKKCTRSLNKLTSNGD